MPSTPDEKRNHPRVQFKTRVTLTYDDTQSTFTADTRDISLKGLFVKADSAPPLGISCDIALELSGATSRVVLLIKGRVVRHMDDGFGIAFDAVELDSYQHLKHILLFNAADPAAVESQFPAPASDPGGSFG